MHHKIGILRFPHNKPEPIVWMGSMNALGHYSSDEIMQRSQSQELYDCLAQLLKLGMMEAALSGRKLATAIQDYLVRRLNAVCPNHNKKMRLKFARKTRFRSYFLSCPNWSTDGCENTCAVDIELLNEAFQSIDGQCTTEGCNGGVEARIGRGGVYLKCTEGHFVDLAL